jgi:virulence factor Mce-like protein
MKRVLISVSILLALGAFVFVTTGAGSSKNSTPTYKIDLDNAFGLVTGADFKVAGVRAGKISSIDLNQKSLNAVVTVTVNQAGLSQFHTSATCDSEPQSLIGEYFINCDPGSTGPVLKNGATIPVSHTQSTVPADLLLDIMQMPEQERLPMIINSLGAGVAGRSGDLQAALDRAVPALRETDNLLSLLAGDSHTIQSLTATANQVVTALAHNTGAVTRFIQYARNAAADTADQKVAFARSLHDLPGFLAQLRPAMKRLGQATDANTPVLENLHASAAQLDRLFTDLPGFANASRPALRALGKASVTGKQAAQAATPTVQELNAFATHTPELAQNLAIVLPHLDNRKYATEPNSRSPGGKGYTGLEALLQYVFNQSASINYYGPFGHMLAVDGFLNPMCSPYASPATVAMFLKQDGAAYRQCYAFLGPNQPGVTTTDPSNPHACVPDPGGQVSPGVYGDRSAPTSACKLSAASDQPSAARRAGRRSGSKGARSGGSTSSGGKAANPVSQSLNKLSQTVSQVLGLLGGNGGSGGLGGVGSKVGSVTHHVSSPTTSSGSSSGASQTARLLNYLLAP